MDTTTLEEVKNGTTTDNGPTTRANATTTSKDLLEAGTPGEESEQLAELGLESVARLVPAEGEEVDELSPDADGLTEVTSEASGETAFGQPEEADEAALLPAYYGSYEIKRSAEAKQAEEVIIGVDDRVRIHATRSYPWRAICSLRILTRTGKTYTGN